MIQHPLLLGAFNHPKPIDTAIALEWVLGLAARDQCAEQNNAEESHDEHDV